ncbi:TM2 domain-containing protein 3 isoform X3 [Dermochelys coriacea]|uniref:TM2 domain-containing protein 3 isoform X3 n=1 Tax=Dermochelys coriacea TaxID=27794 RepID=UPI0018E90862|nr:TM2 domain-containing protein 3 isoform X3 [Dermochelys coriacea]
MLYGTNENLQQTLAGSLMTTEHSKQQFVSTKGVTSPSTSTPYTKTDSHTRTSHRTDADHGRGKTGIRILIHFPETTEIPFYVSKCPSNGLCSKLPPDCMTCKTNFSCVYGKLATFDCKIKPQIHCIDQRNNEVENFTINMTCQFCWQLEPADYVCTNSTSCMTVSCPRQRYNATCTVHDHIHCLGNRVFPKMLYCNWTGGYKWSTALALSITLGGFGADRFYLGQWREGLGKLFSFGGLGIWTLIDVLLIGVGYVGPADGSLYI